MGQTINPFGKKIIEVSGDFCGKELRLETGRLAFQATSSVTARYGDTVVEAIVSVADRPNPGLDFFPLSVITKKGFMQRAKSVAAGLSSVKAGPLKTPFWPVG